MKNRVQYLISKLDLQPHPEGGYFRETYRSKGSIPKKELSDRITGNRNYCTGIYFLLTSDNFSAFHRINQDEMWHFYEGSALTIHMINEKGTYSNQKVGMDLDSNEVPQFTVPKHVWFAAEVNEPDSYSLVGCTVSPGFDFRDFELAERTSFINSYPDLEEVILRFTR